MNNYKFLNVKPQLVNGANQWQRDYTKSVPIKPQRVLVDRGIWKGARAPNRWQFSTDFRRRGAECTPSISNMNIEWENVIHNFTQYWIKNHHTHIWYEKNITYLRKNTDLKSTMNFQKFKSGDLEQLLLYCCHKKLVNWHP